MNINDASRVLAPRSGQITVTSLTAGAASASIAIQNADAGAYISISIDDGAGGTPLDAYLTCGGLGVTITDPSPTGTSGDGRTMRYTAAQLAAGLIFNKGDAIKVYAIGSGTVYLRQYRSSP